jgi:hypothetical protein
MKKFILFLLLVPGMVMAQSKSNGELLKETTQAYLDAKYLSMDVNVVTYQSASDPGVLLGQGMIRKSGTEYYSKFLSDELIVNNNCTVVLDHGDKTITWYDMEKQKKNKDKGQELPNMDSLSGSDSIVFKGVENKQRHFMLYSRSAYAAIHLTEVFINEETHFVERIIYYYQNNSDDEAYDMYKVVIDYTNISTQKPSDSFFSERRYLTYSKGEPVLTAAYANYKLIIPH